MACLFSELRCKEVIDLHSGQRLGYVCDAEYEPCDGKILAIISPRPGPGGGPAGPGGRLRHPLVEHLAPGQRHHTRGPPAVPLPPAAGKEAVFILIPSRKKARRPPRTAGRRFFVDTKKARRQASLVSGVFTALRRRGSPFRCGGSGCRRRRAWGFRLLWP